MVSRAIADDIRSLDFDSISAAYATVGTVLLKPARIMTLTNNTEGEMIFSDDNLSDAGKWFLRAGSFRLIDFQANMNTQFDDKYVLPIGTQFFVKQLTAPVSGSVYIEIFSE